ncbi:MAG: hypothetical protein CMF31_10525 [Kordiimonas sp.]|nr:hypothetical protein [Kordiimonas sp.]
MEHKTVKRVVFSTFFVLMTTCHALAESVVVTLDEAKCAELVAHLPQDDVTYRPGKDVHGQAVVPADLPKDDGLWIPETVKIPIEIDLQKRAGSEEHNVGGVLMEMPLGEIKVIGNDVFYNGYAIDSASRAQLTEACHKLERREMQKR